MRNLFQFVLLLTFCVSPIQLSATSCHTEYGTVIKTPRGRLISKEGKPISRAQIEVRDNSNRIISRTTTKEDGKFNVEVGHEKYKVTVWAEDYNDFVYYMDLRSKDSGAVFDVPLVPDSSCSDMRVFDPDQDKREESCASEQIFPNLKLRVTTRISGQIKDQTGDTFKNSALRLVSESRVSVVQPLSLYAKTDVEGKFVFDEVAPGEYRLLASPHRGFAQPEKLDCYEQAECKLDIVLKANPSDLPYAACPIK